MEGNHKVWSKNYCFEVALSVMQEILFPLRLRRKTRIVIDYDPANEETTIEYFYPDKLEESES